MSTRARHLVICGLFAFLAGNISGALIHDANIAPTIAVETPAAAQSAPGPGQWTHWTDAPGKDTWHKIYPPPTSIKCNCINGEVVYGDDANHTACDTYWATPSTQVEVVDGALVIEHPEPVGHRACITHETSYNFEQ